MPDSLDSGPIRAALLIALMQTPQRFRTKRQLWAYSGLALEDLHQ
jgi:transposase